MIIVVTGGRDFTNTGYIFGCLDYLHGLRAVSGLIHGGARGVDTLCGMWAVSRGVPEIKCPANWDKYGKSAGIIRNQSMLVRDPAPEYAVIFPGGRGTSDMRQRIIKTGLPYWDCANAIT